MACSPSKMRCKLFHNNFAYRSDHDERGLDRAESLLTFKAGFIPGSSRDVRAFRAVVGRSC